MAADNFKKIVEIANSGKKYPVLSLINNSAGMATALSKLVAAPIPPMYDGNGNRRISEPNTFAFKNTSEHLAQNISDARTVLQTLPDMELSAQILVSSILSPKDMVTTELTYAVSEGIIAPDIGASLIAIVKRYFEQDYKIKPLLPKMLRDMLFETGSYPVAVIPENSIDEMINGNGKITLEALSSSVNTDGTIKSIGLLGPVIKQETKNDDYHGISLESFNSFIPDKTVTGKITFEGQNQMPAGGWSETYLSVCDNPNLLKVPKINQKIREDRIKGMISTRALESIHTKLTDREMTGLVYKERNVNFKPISSLKTQEQLNRNTVGNPLVLHLPTESVIPVYVPGCVEEQIGFFVLIDVDGNPVAKAADSDYYQQLSSRLNSNGSFPSAMLTRVKQQMSGFNVSDKDHMNYVTKVYGDMVEQDILARLRNGVYGNGVALAKNEEVYRIMLSRTLAKQHTQLLFIPIELMTYMAFKYTDDGLGKSILDEMKILNSLRSMILFANVMSSLKNSIGRTEVKLKLDESDPNPQKTIEIAMHEIVRSRQQYFPLGMNSPTDLTDWLQKSGFEFTFEGHPGIPDVAIDFGEKNSNYIKPDNELEENLRKKSIMAVGLSPETVDASFQAEFATSIVANNVLLSKRVVQTQEQFTPQLSNHMRKCIMHSEKVLNELRAVLVDNFDKLNLELTDDGKKVIENINAGSASDEVKVKTEQEKTYVINNILNQFIMNFEVSLPKPNSVTLENQMAALEIYSKALDTCLDAVISDKFFTSDTGGDVANQVNTIKEVLKAYYLRSWMSENGVMPELAELTILDHEGKPVVDVYKQQQSHIENLTKALTSFMVGLKEVKDASNTVMNSIGGVPEETTSSSSTDGSSGDTGGDDFGGDGGDDFGLPAAPNLDLPEETGSEPEVPASSEPEEVKPDDKKPDEVVPVE